MHRAGGMAHSHSHGNGRNVALPDENRPSWRPEDELHRTRRGLSEEDDRFEDERYARYWEDRGDRLQPDRTRGFEQRNQGYPGAFEERYRDRAYQERLYGGPRGYDYGDGDRGPRYQPEPSPNSRLFGHRGKGPAGYHRSDERIHEAVCEALTEDDRIDATRIDVTVRDGEVTLAGTVDERLMKRFAEDLVEHVSGVRDVQNLLRIGHGR